MTDFDEGVSLRELRFRAEMAGYRIEHGHYIDGEDDRADRWYVVPASRKASTAADRSGRGFRTIKAAADEAERIAGERGKPTPRRADPDARAHGGGGRRPRGAAVRGHRVRCLVAFIVSREGERPGDGFVPRIPPFDAVFPLYWNGGVR